MACNMSICMRMCMFVFIRRVQCVWTRRAATFFASGNAQECGLYVKCRNQVSVLLVVIWCVSKGSVDKHCMISERRKVCLYNTALLSVVLAQDVRCHYRPMLFYVSIELLFILKHCLLLGTGFRGHKLVNGFSYYTRGLPLEPPSKGVCISLGV